MTEWKTIDSAPVDRMVKVGRWVYYGNEKTWHTDTAIVYKMVKGTVFKRKISQFGISIYSHWAELDAPPTSE